MNFVLRLIAVSVMTISSVPACLRAETTNEAVARATAAIQAAAPRAQADPARPVFHVASLAQWMNDPNGPIYYKGYYHLFYQLHPFSDGDGPKYWGHVRSRDLAKWEPLPIALWPSTELGEQGVWSGCCTVNGLGQPMIFYTSVAIGKSAQTHAEQWAAISDDDLATWHKSPANPVLSEALHGEKKIYDWRDPFVFRDAGRTFLVTGGNLNAARGGEAVVNIYEAENPGFTKWTYRGVLFKIPDPRAGTAECPNFFKLGNRWVLFVSPYGRVQYYVGDFDAQSCRFQARTNGLLDCGRSFYAPNTMQVPDGRRLVWGWVNGFPGGRGWNGCLSVPRVLSLSPQGDLRQNPAPQLTRLRGKAIEWRNIRLGDDGHSFALPATNTLEIAADIEMESAGGIQLAIEGGTNKTQLLTIDCNGGQLNVQDVHAPLIPTDLDPRHLNLHVFVDHSVLEVFANESVCVTKIISPLGTGSVMSVRAANGAAKARRIQAWPVKTIW
jgi:sucrose-6-phosphate hydrolase SacC (GH32 family)